MGLPPPRVNSTFVAYLLYKPSPPREEHPSPPHYKTMSAAPAGGGALIGVVRPPFAGACYFSAKRRVSLRCRAFGA